MWCYNWYRFILTKIYRSHKHSYSIRRISFTRKSHLINEYRTPHSPFTNVQTFRKNNPYYIPKKTRKPIKLFNKKIHHSIIYIIPRVNVKCVVVCTIFVVKNWNPSNSLKWKHVDRRTGIYITEMCFFFHFMGDVY